MQTIKTADRSIETKLFCLLPLLLTGSLASASEHLLDLHERAKQARELWTVLQVEAALNALDEPPRFRPAFGDHIVAIGDLRLTFPSRIITHTDLGDRILVLSGTKVYQLDGDGWPADLPIALPTNINYGNGSARFSADGRALGYARPSGGWPPPAVELIGVDLTTGEVKLHSTINHTIPLGPEENIGLEHLAVSPDGSHIAVEVWSHAQNRGGIMIANSQGHQLIPNWRHPRAIARDGEWWAASDPNVQLRAMRGVDNPIESMPDDPGTVVVGPGMLAFHDRILNPAGEVQALNLPAGCTAVGMERRGAWLIVAVTPGPPESTISDQGAIPRPARLASQPTTIEPDPEDTAVDLFSVMQPPTNPAAEPVNEPETTDAETTSTTEHGALWFSWDDLATDPSSPPRHTAAGEGTIAHTPGSVIRIVGSTLERLTPAGDVLLREEIITLDTHIDSVWREKNYLVLELSEQERAVVEPTTGLLVGRFSQPTDHVVGIPRHGFASVISPRGGDQRTVTIHRLAADPAERWQRTLVIPEPFTQFTEAYVHHDEGHSLMVINEDRNWLVLDTQNNEVTQRGRPDEGRPNFGHIDWSTNRFNRRWEFARLVEIPQTTNDSISLADATITGTTLLTVDNSGSVTARDLRRGEYSELGSLANARRFAWSGSSRVPYLANTDGTIIGRIEGRAVTAYTGRNARAPNEASWQLNGTTFRDPGRSTPMEWSQSLTGFRPMHLRTPTKAQMLVILPHVVLICDRTGVAALSEQARR